MQTRSENQTPEGNHRKHSFLEMLKKRPEEAYPLKKTTGNTAPAPMRISKEAHLPLRTDQERQLP